MKGFEETLGGFKDETLGSFIEETLAATWEPGRLSSSRKALLEAKANIQSRDKVRQITLRRKNMASRLRRN